MIEPYDVLRVVCSHDLPGAELMEAVGDQVPALTEEVLGLAHRHRVQGLVWKAIGAGAVHAEPSVVDSARDRLADALSHRLIAESAAVRAVAALEQADVDVRVLKGVAVAHLDYADATERVFVDADLLIRRRQHAAAIEALSAAGHDRVSPPLHGWWERRYGKALVMRADGGSELDVHLGVTGGYFGVRIDHDEIWQLPGDPFELDGHLLSGLDLESRWLHACCHAVLGGGSGLRSVRDVAQLVLVSGADWRSVVDRATADGVELVVAGAVRLAWSELGLDHGHELVGWASTLDPDEAQVTALRGYEAAFDAGWGPEGRSMLAALGPLDRVPFVAGLVVPPRGSLRARGRTWRSHARQVFTVARGST